jgi:hypothetical protein
MAIATYPAVASPVKSVQRGSAGGAGTVTISAVDINKSMVNIFGTSSSGTVSASFNMSMNAGSLSLVGHGNANNNYGSTAKPSGASSSPGQDNAGWNAWTLATTVNSGNASVGAGSTNLIAGVVQGYLSNSTSLVVTGACRYEVVEFN